MKNTQKKEFEKTRNFQFSAKKYFEVPMDAFSQKISSNLPTNLNMWIKVVFKIFETEKVVCNLSPASGMWIQYKTASKPMPVLQSKQNQGQLPSTKCKGLRNHQRISQMAHLSPSFSKNRLLTIVPSNLQKLDSALWWLSSLCGLRKKLHGTKAADKESNQWFVPRRSFYLKAEH